MECLEQSIVKRGPCRPPITLTCRISSRITPTDGPLTPLGLCTSSSPLVHDNIHIPFSFETSWRLPLTLFLQCLKIFSTLSIFLFEEVFQVKLYVISESLAKRILFVALSSPGISTCTPWVITRMLSGALSRVSCTTCWVWPCHRCFTQPLTGSPWVRIIQ